MTEFPQLADALEQAARRHYSPSPLRRARGAVAPLAAAAAVAGLALVLLRADTGPPADERAVEPATVANVFGQDFEVFRRPRRESDELPSGSRAPFLSDASMEDLDISRSRLAATLGDVRLYLIPVPVDMPGVCMVTYLGDAAGGASCTTLKSAADERTPMASLGRPRSGRPGTTEALFPDGVRDVRLTLADGSIVPAEVSGNVVLTAHEERVTSMSWTGPSGDRHALGGADPDPNERPEDRGCVDAEPLSDDLGAERVARDAVPRLLPGDDGTVIASRNGDEDARLETMSMACGAQVRARIRVFDFRSGSIAVARVAGRLQVLSVLERR